MSTVSPVTPPPAPTPGAVPNHLAWAIVATVLGFCLCCPSIITGIVAIVFSSKVNGLLNQGDLDGARRASNSAKTWCWVTTALAIIGLLINIGMVATGGMQRYMEYVNQMQHMS
ncbi:MULTISPECIES: CD225/dispanin family protein [Xanthomonas translucens group]|uniref:CD225/dispanin family protein n=1 Tax=Xanthomonas cerealis pv. cerealis TaxID=152263 RepID=A0A514EFR9_9XANT|nr:CD225/dispanin family protein [Xanthomonas translucens]QDI04880.1 CD225/dispanin family protein [Xanthomonas translucens pv. cerealis]UKE46893.1 CD225/dispanin family protein [Xanthomonas translucens pv. cerealis]UKE69253.1 CD225/dispanin family protein [Xanthomonas translucens pv. pistacia]